MVAVDKVVEIDRAGSVVGWLVGWLVEVLRPGRSKELSKEELMEIPPMGLGLFFRISNTTSSFFSKEENLSSTLPMILSSIPSSLSTLRWSCLNTSKSLVLLFFVAQGSLTMQFAFSSLALR